MSVKVSPGARTGRGGRLSKGEVPSSGRLLSAHLRADQIEGGAE